MSHGGMTLRIGLTTDKDTTRDRNTKERAITTTTQLREKGYVAHGAMDHGTPVSHTSLNTNGFLLHDTDVYKTARWHIIARIHHWKVS